MSWARGQWGGFLMSSVTGQAMSIGPAQSLARSVPEKAATTPSTALAFDRSTFLIRAWANGLRTTATHSVPGIVRSSV